MIAQIVQGKDKGFKFYAEDGSDLGNIRKGVRVDPSLSPPQRLAELIEGGEKISRLIKTRVRVDFFENEEGLFFGEIALRPGGDQKYDPAIDRMLEQCGRARARAFLKKWETHIFLENTFVALVWC